MSVHSLGYVRLSTPNPERWQEFATVVLGLMPVQGALDGAQHYRIDDHPPRLVVQEGDAPSLDAIGFEVTGPRVLAALAERLAALGISVEEGSAEEVRRRRALEMVRFAAPGDVPVELWYGPILDHVPVVTPLVSRFVTGDQGMGHVVFTTSELAAARELFVEALGFEERNQMHLPYTQMTFLGVNRRHHTVAMMEAPGAPKLMHLMFQVATLTDVGRALDRCDQLGYGLMFTLGEHVNDGMTSFYVYTPDGSAVEVGCGGVEVDGPSPVSVITKSSHWGHRFSPFVAETSPDA
jgi:3,4-dihydroxy-9,10-secoandrosta-1,3,5(10)-triene-9,17-dione 4,5-dioxygenase